MASSSSSTSSWPPGVRFVPTDQEIILDYLNVFSKGYIRSWPHLPIHRVNIYESNPQQLSVDYEKGNLTEWFFISERTKKHKGGKKQERSDNGGFWHATGKTVKIDGVVGYKTALTYYVGKPPNAEKTNWLMQEYSLHHSSHITEMVDYALCKIYLSPRAKKKMKVEEVEALEEEVLGNLEFHQSQFWPLPLGSHPTQSHDIPDQEQDQQFWTSVINSLTQPHDDDIPYLEDDYEFVNENVDSNNIDSCSK